MNRFVFLDRDGTLTRDTGFPHRVEELELLPGVGQGLRRLQRAGYRLAILSNQSGIGRGLFPAEACAAFDRALHAALEREAVRLERSFYCPHSPADGCRCRKPAPGLAKAACAALGADPACSWMIGDKASDAELAERAGLRGAVIVAHNAAPEAPFARWPGALLARDLPGAAERILKADARGPGGDPSDREHTV